MGQFLSLPQIYWENSELSGQKHLSGESISFYFSRYQTIHPTLVVTLNVFIIAGQLSAPLSTL